MFGSRLRGKLKAFVKAKPAPREVDPDDLGDTELILLSKAAQHPEGRVPDCECAANETGRAILLRLEQMGLIDPLARGECSGADTPDDHGSASSPAYHITAAGFSAIGVINDGVVADDPVSHERSAEASPTVSIPTPLILKAVSPISDADRQDRNSRQGGSNVDQLAESSKAKPAAKIARLVELLQSGDGAGLTDLRTLTGWQPHSIRAAISRLRKAGFAITSERSGGNETVYHLIPASEGTSGHTALVAEASRDTDRAATLASGPVWLSSGAPVEPLAFGVGAPLSSGRVVIDESR